MMEPIKNWNYLLLFDMIELDWPHMFDGWYDTNCLWYLSVLLCGSWRRNSYLEVVSLWKVMEVCYGIQLSCGILMYASPLRKVCQFACIQCAERMVYLVFGLWKFRFLHYIKMFGWIVLLWRASLGLLILWCFLSFKIQFGTFHKWTLVGS